MPQSDDTNQKHTKDAVFHCLILEHIHQHRCLQQNVSIPIRRQIRSICIIVRHTTIIVLIAGKSPHSTRFDRISQFLLIFTICCFIFIGKVYDHQQCHELQLVIHNTSFDLLLYDINVTTRNFPSLGSM